MTKENPTVPQFILAIMLIGFLFLPLFATVNAGHQSPPAAECPQPRLTDKAPGSIYDRANPLAANRKNRKAGRNIYQDLSVPGCAVCHGEKGAGDGPLAGQFNPRPRNFACPNTIRGIPDGQLFWIIKNGSAGTAMPRFDYLSDDEIWQLVLYLRSLSGHD